MPNFDQLDFIIYILIGMHSICYGAAGGWLLYHNQEQHDQSRIYIGILFLSLAIGSLTFIITGLSRDDLGGFMDTIMEPYPLLISFLPHLLMATYLLEVLHPNWLTLKRFILIISPWIIISIAWLVCHGLNGWHYETITHLTDWHQIGQSVDQPDVQIRLMQMALYPLYTLVVPFIPYNWRTCNINSNHIVWLKLLVMVCFMGFVPAMALRIQPAIIAYLVAWIC